MTQLRRYKSRLTPARLMKALRGEALVSEALASGVGVEELDAIVAALDPTLSGSAIDQALIEPLHRALTGLAHAEAADMRVWHWLAAERYPQLVWRRWRPAGVPHESELEGAVTSAMFRRFAGLSSLAGVSRNTFARLWWTAEHLNGDYELARFALSKQDMFQAVFERLFGLYSPASVSALKEFRGRSEDEIRNAARWLNFAAATTLLEGLTETDVRSLIADALPRGE